MAKGKPASRSVAAHSSKAKPDRGAVARSVSAARQPKPVSKPARAAQKLSARLVVKSVAKGSPSSRPSAKPVVKSLAKPAARPTSAGQGKPVPKPIHTPAGKPMVVGKPVAKAPAMIKPPIKPVVKPGTTAGTARNGSHPAAAGKPAVNGRPTPANASVAAPGKPLPPRTTVPSAVNQLATQRLANQPPMVNGMGPPKVVGEELLELVFRDDIYARQLFSFLAVRTVNELEKLTPNEIFDQASRPIRETLDRVRRQLALLNRTLKNDQAFALAYLKVRGTPSHHSR
ncbi:MAG: hypothetical protein ACKO3P_16745 [Planctomycetaceae bacterium]